ncbi:MAG: type IV pilus modification protein PilV [Proteobacteria bacterium]|nr:type IV pilus modification protein PilV [Pseudomonadota bacterium]MDA0994555.1 type IV pilus modification protein PilV [Pseudomonadota bacterium]
MRLTNSVTAQSGFSLLELLVSLVIFSVGLMGVAGLQIVSKQSNYESQQRTIASQVAYALLEDMRTNGAAISVYQSAGDLGGSRLAGLPVESCRYPNTPCSAAQKAVHDLWYWERVVDGVQETGVEGPTGGVVSPTICIEGPAGGVAGVYAVSIAWRGTASMSNPDRSQCGANSGKYGTADAYRRVLQVATFIDPNF